MDGSDLKGAGAHRHAPLEPREEASTGYLQPQALSHLPCRPFNERSGDSTMKRQRNETAMIMQVLRPGLWR